MNNFNATTRAFSATNASWLGKASALAYDDDYKILRETGSWGLCDIMLFNARDTQSYLAGNDDMLILAFRGTESLRDWMTDADIDLVGGPGGRVHEGFSVALNYVWRDIWKYLRECRKGRALWITGHSLGAALATLATARLRLEKDEPVNGLYTFGSPRVGDREFARNFNADFEAGAFRYVNNNDIVTRVPFRALRYSHVGTFRYFDEYGAQRDDISWWGKVVDRLNGRLHDILEPGTDGIKDHSIREYVTRLAAAEGIQP